MDVFPLSQPAGQTVLVDAEDRQTVGECECECECVCARACVLMVGSLLEKKKRIVILYAAKALKYLK